ncbi:helix-turn-helix transcriptional regulator [Nocardia flavorosea]|uniref:Helix-turn-helix transcriptional regulator n=1 Tax=Nocardia flavorosea TaxID=53429 RepID=A0A846YHN8_9NOCA|nr:helix-turn-helix transcriptional regulator [Nocardia flavorosea]
MVRIRNLRRLTVRQLSERLGDIGAPMLPSGITNIEKGKRTVTAENLLEFAAALNASPADFLSAPDEGRVSIAPNMEDVGSAALRSWLAGTQPLSVPEGVEYENARKELLEAAPAWFRQSEERLHQTFRHPAVSKLSELQIHARAAILEEEGIEPGLLAATLRDRLEEVTAYVNLLADEVERRGNDA